MTVTQNDPGKPRRRRWWTRQSITTKYLVYFLTLAIVILTLTGSAAVALVEQVSQYAKASIEELGETVKVERGASMVGRRMTMVVAPAKHAARASEKG